MRITAFTDACVLVSPLKRNVLLTLAAAGFFQLRWSPRVLDETERAISRLRQRRGLPESARDAARARRAMEDAFEDALVTGFEVRPADWPGLPDADDVHVIAAAVHGRADVIVTDNLRHFPATTLRPLRIEARSADRFLASIVGPDPARTVAALATMRQRFRRPEITAEGLLARMEVEGLTATVALLRAHASRM